MNVVAEAHMVTVMLVLLRFSHRRMRGCCIYHQGYPGPGLGIYEVFVRAISPLGRRIGADGSDRAGCFAAQAGERAARLCRPRPRLRPGCGQRVCSEVGQTVLPAGLKEQCVFELFFLFFFFQ